ncbi:MAG: kelch repeat-containing protein [Bacteroidia bacterium]
MKRNFILLISFLIINGLNLSRVYGQSHWTQKADFTSSRGGVSPFSINSKGYYSCGLDNSSNAYNDLWEYDPVTDVWTQKANLPGVNRYSASAFTIGNYGYVCLGWDINGNGLDDLWQYDPLLNSWTTKSNFAGSARYNSVAFVVGGKAYVGLGYKPIKDDMYEYDPVTDVWTILANTFPGGARTTATAFSCTYIIAGTTYEKGFVGTGDLNPDVNTLLANDLWEFTPGVSPGSGTWLAKSNLPANGRFAAFAFTLNDRGYIGGGIGVGLAKYNDFYEYDPVTDTWAVKDSFPGINSIHARGFAINNKGYAGSGFDLTANYPYFYEYAPAFTPIVQLSSSDTAFCEKQCIDFYDLSTNNPTSWQWFFPGADSLTSSLQNPAGICYNNYGGFDVTLIACNVAGCDTLVLTNFINEYPAPVATITQSNDTLFASAGVSYQWWSVDSGIIAGANNNYIVPFYGGNYYVVISDSIGCEGASNVISITGIKQLAIGNWQLAIVPNPNNGNFTISIDNFSNKDFSFRFINCTGQSVFAKTKYHPAIGQSKITIDVNMGNVAAGLYAIEIIASEKVYRGRFIIQ